MYLEIANPKLFRFTHAHLKAINEPMSTDVSRTGEVFQEWRKLFKQLHFKTFNNIYLEAALCF